MNSLVGGDIDFIIDGAVTPMVKADRVTPLATFYRRRHPELPQVPTLKEAGFEIRTSQGSGWGLLAPKGTPAAIMKRLSEALEQVLKQQDVQDAFARANSIAAWQPPQQLRLSLQRDREMYAELLPAIGIREN